MQHLYFIRHGQSVKNEEGIFSGKAETPLTALGKEQAQVAGQVLLDKTIDCIVASPLGRTTETAGIIADMLEFPKEKIIFNDLFIERDFGPLEGTQYQFNLGDVDGVEPIADLLVRAEQGLAFLKTLDATNILVVSHGAIGRALRHSINPAIPYRPSTGFKNGDVVQLI